MKIAANRGRATPWGDAARTLRLWYQFCMGRSSGVVDENGRGSILGWHPEATAPESKLPAESLGVQANISDLR